MGLASWPQVHHHSPELLHCGLASCNQLQIHRSVFLQLQAADFGPRTSLKVVDQIRRKLKDGKLKNGEQIRSELKLSILELLQKRGGNTDLQLGDTQPGVILVVGVNGGGKTTTIGKLAHKFNSEGVKVKFTVQLFQHASVGDAAVYSKTDDLPPNYYPLQHALVHNMFQHQAVLLAQA